MSDTTVLDVLMYCGAGTVACLYYMVRGYLTSRGIVDMPLSTIAASAQGPVAVQGKAYAADSGSLKAPHSGRPCVFYNIKVEDRNGNDSSSVLEYSSKNLFILRDETGECQIDPSNARLFKDAMQQVFWSGKFNKEAKKDGSLCFVSNPPMTEVDKLEQRQLDTFLVSSGSNYFFTESIIAAEQVIYVEGFKDQNTIRQAERVELHRECPFIISSKDKDALTKNQSSISFWAFTLAVVSIAVGSAVYILSHGNFDEKILTLLANLF